MKRFRITSIALLIVPLLNTGCIQDKVSTIKPSTEKRATQSSNDTNQSSKTDNNSTTTSYHNSKELEQLALSIQKIITNNAIDSFVEPIIIGNNWIEISKEEEIVLTAQEYMGKKYVWAANGPECFDCSGFTRYVFKEHGINLPRYSGYQAKVGTQIEYNELQIGDLVFFDTEKKYHKKVNHVGIYIGDDKFIHASSAKKKVIITSFKKKKFYKNRFLWGQRVINSNNTYASL